MEIQFYKVEEAAKILNTKTSTVRTYCREGKIPAIKVGRGYRIAKEDLERWIRLHKQGSASFDEEQLRLFEAEAKYKDIFEHASDAIAIFDNKGHLTLANPRFYDLFGYTPKEMEGIHFTKLVFPADLPDLAERFMLRLTGEGTPSRYNTRIVHKNGQIIDVESNTSQVYAEGKLSGLQVILRDVTERKKVEEALRESEEKYRRIFETTKEAIIISDSSGKIVSANPAAAEILGFKFQKELLGKSAIDFYKNREDRKKLFKKLLEKGYVKDFILEVRRQDGTLATLQASFSTQLDNKGNVLYTNGIFHDISKRKKAEEELAASEARYRSLVDNSLEGIGISKGNQIVYANKAILDIFGYKTLDEFSKVPLLDHVAPKSRDMIQERLEQRKKGKSISSRYQYSIVRKDGEIRDLEISSYEIIIDGETYVQGTFRDITERKKAEEALRESEQMYKALVRASADAVVMSDLEGNLTYVSPQAVKLYGAKSTKELLGKSSTDFVAPEDRKKALEAVRRTAERGIVRNLKLTLLRVDKTRYVAEFTTSLMKDAKGGPKAFIATMRIVSG